MERVRSPIAWSGSSARSTTWWQPSGGWWQASPVWATSDEAWEKMFLDLATAHFAIARAWFPRVPAYGSYQLIVGGSAIYPIEQSGIVSMQQAALLMMGGVLGAEAPQSRVFRHVLGAVNNRRRPFGRREWMNVEDVGRLATLLAAHEQIPSQELRQVWKSEQDEVFAEIARLISSTAR